MNAGNRFVDNGDGTVSDAVNGLMWSRTDTINDLEKWVNYQEAQDYVRALNDKKFSGYDDWRLPTLDDLGLLYDESSLLKDKFNKDIHISGCFQPGCGCSIFSQPAPGRFRMHVLDLRTGEFTNPDAVWTISEATRAVRSINP